METYYPVAECFNGAAALTLRKRSEIRKKAPSDFELQWGRSVNAAETRGSAVAAPAPSRFNGAAALTLRKPEGVSVSGLVAGSFNGAAALTLRKPTTIWA